MKWRFNILLLIVLLLSGCASNTGINGNVFFESAQYLNPDINGRSSPLVVTLYELKSPSSFNNASYDDLANNSGDVLGADLLDQHNYEIQPNSKRKVTLSMPAETQALGVTAAYRNIDKVTWRKVVPMPKSITNPNMVEKYLSKSISLTIQLESQGLVVRKK